MTETESLELLERKVLRHLAIKAGRNPGYFVAPNIEGLKRATWCDDEDLIKSLVGTLVQKSQIIPASRMIDSRKVYGFVCLPAKLRGPKVREIHPELRLTPYDLKFLKECGIWADESNLTVPNCGPEL